MAALCILSAAACGFDYCKRKIPNGLVALLIVTGILFRIRQDAAVGIILYLGEAAAVMAPLYVIYKIGAVGAGDVKLLGAAAGYLSFQKIFMFSFVSLLIAAIISLVKLFIHKNFKERLCIFRGYLEKVTQQGTLLPYPVAEKDKRTAGVCLSGPVLLSLLLHLGGVY